MEGIRSIPDNLRTARRRLEEIANVTILDDWTWNEKIFSWVLQCQLVTPDYVAHPFLPEITNWHVVVSSEYPLGRISFFPAISNGISRTFQHQLNNSKISNDLPWRLGSICLDLNVKVLGRLFEESEPFSFEERLAWYFHRALNWLKAASHGEFTKPGEPFELPDFSTNKEYTVAFSESASSFAFWMKSTETVGTVSLLNIDTTSVLIATSFLNRFGKQILSLDWGSVVNSTENKYYKGLWIRLNDLPVVEPWQPPSTFGELSILLKNQNIDFYETIKSVTSEIRDGAKHFLLLGFPISLKFGETPIRLHWQAILLPRLSSGSKTMKGFRPNETGRYLRDKQQIINQDTAINWISSENWNEEQISARGRLSASLAKKKILIIGCGAIGSLVAELLVRGNVNRIVLIDKEPFEVGNLVRHTLELGDVKKPKAKQLARRLRSINPNAKVNFIDSSFPPTLEKEINLIRQCDLVIDCTADDEVLFTLGKFPWGGEKQITRTHLKNGF